MSIELMFAEIRNEDNSGARLEVSLNLNNHEETERVTKWARLGIRISAQMMAEMVVDFDPDLPASSAKIEIREIEDVDGDTISFKLLTGDAHNHIGGLTSPAVVLAHEVFSALDETYQGA